MSFERLFFYTTPLAQWEYVEFYVNRFEPPPSFSTAQAKVEALLNPRNIVIVGASDAPESWAMKPYQNLRRYSFPRPGLSDQSAPRTGVGHALLSLLR